MPEARAASCSLLFPLAKQGPATALKGVQEFDCFLQLILVLGSRAVEVVKTELVVTVVHGTEGTSCSCLAVSLVVGPASGASGNFSLTSCGGSKAEVVEPSCSEDFLGGYFIYPHKCLSHSRGLLLSAPVFLLSLMEPSALHTPHIPPLKLLHELGHC